MFGLVALAGCGGDPVSPLLVIGPEPKGEHCPDGGSVLRSGLDKNQDGRLSPEEVTGESYACNGANAQPLGQTTLVRLRPEPAGAACADGGTAVLSGLDSNDDGVLSDDEVTSTSYVCGGASGTIVRVLPEPPGPNCLRGGSRVQSGVDQNHNGSLDDAEAVDSAYVCNPVPAVLTGDVTVANAANLARSTGVPRIEGNLIIADPTLTQLFLPDLMVVDGDLRIDPPSALVSMQLPTLVTVGGSVLLDADALVELRLPRLRTASGFVVSAQSLTTVGLDALTAVDGNFALLGTPLVGLPALPQLRRVGTFRLSNNPELTLLELPNSLRTIDGDLALYGTPSSTGPPTSARCRSTAT